MDRRSGERGQEAMEEGEEGGGAPFSKFATCRWDPGARRLRVISAYVLKIVHMSDTLLAAPRGF
jgi:hypothetical protein